MSAEQPPAPRRARFIRRRRIVTPIPAWDLVDFLGLASYDVEALRADVVARVEQHLAAGSVDEAHGDVVDRIVHEVTQAWQARLHVAYIARFDDLQARHSQGIEHLGRLDVRLAALTERREEAERIAREARAELTGRRSASESDDAATAPGAAPSGAASRRKPLTSPHLRPAGGLAATATA